MTERQQKILDFLDVLATKGAELAHRARVTSDYLKRGEESEFLFEMTLVSVADVEFWGGALRKSISAGGGNGS